MNLRMDAARRLLRETKKSVVDIGLEVGYANPSHFAQLFRRETGLARAIIGGSVKPEMCGAWKNLTRPRNFAITVLAVTRRRSVVLLKRDDN